MFGMKQTQKYVCTLEEFISSSSSLLYKDELIWKGNYTYIYTNIWIDMTYENWIHSHLTGEGSDNYIQLRDYGIEIWR